MESREVGEGIDPEQKREVNDNAASGTEEACEKDADLWNTIMESGTASADDEEYLDDVSFDFEPAEEEEGLADTLDSLPEADIIRNNLYIL